MMRNAVMSAISSAVLVLVSAIHVAADDIEVVPDNNFGFVVQGQQGNERFKVQAGAEVLVVIALLLGVRAIRRASSAV